MTLIWETTVLPIAGFLFDIDGTLIDSNDAHAKAWQEVFAENDFTVPYEKTRACIGMGGDHLLPLLASVRADSAQGQKMEARRGDIFRARYLPTLRPFLKSRDLIETLNAKNYKTVIATSASAKDLKALLHQTDLQNVFDTGTNSGDVEKSKPDPDIIQSALQRADLDPRRAVMVGDTPYDIEAASRAGVRSIGLTCGGWSAGELKKAGAWKVHDSPHDLLVAVMNGQAFI